MVEKSVKEAAMEVLGEEYPLSLIEIKKRVYGKYFLDVSFQAVRKAVNSLLNEGIVERKGKEYSLNRKWIKEQKNLFDSLSREYSVKSGARRKQVSIKGKNFEEFTLNNLYELDNFWADIMMEWADNIGKNEKRIHVGKNHYAWWFLLNYGSETHLHEYYRKKGVKRFIIFVNDNPLNRWAVKNYRGLGAECKIEKITQEGTDYIDLCLQGNLLTAAYYPKDIAKELDKFFKKYGSVNDANVRELQKLAKKKSKIILRTIRDEAVAEGIRNNIMQHFKKK